MTVQPEDIEALIAIFESSNWDELHVKTDDLEIFLSTNPEARVPGNGAPLLQVPTGTHASSSSASPLAVPGLAPSVAAAAHANAAVPGNWVPVTAPSLGTFYRAPKPGAAPFVEVGQTVEAETEICLIEVMKLFTALKAGVGGVVRQICVKDAAMVEFGDTLFYIEPG
jgi:acetyl-CoA carboxylase biotin carboxyl carrier protein